MKETGRRGVRAGSSGRSRPSPSGPVRASSRPFHIAGLPAVTALFARDPDRIGGLVFDKRVKPFLGDLCQALAASRKAYRLVETDELDRIAGTPLHGGVVAFSSPRPTYPFDIEVARRLAEDGRPLLILDGIGNPHNLGAIVRTAAFFGIEHLVLSDHPAQAGPSEAGYRVAEGGFEYVTLYRAARLPVTLKHLGRFYHVVGTALGGTVPLAALQRQRPVAIVMGNEERGLDRATLAACRTVVTIGGAGQIQSLNVSATAAILIHELTRRIVAS